MYVKEPSKDFFWSAFGTTKATAKGQGPWLRIFCGSWPRTASANCEGPESLVRETCPARARTQIAVASLPSRRDTKRKYCPARLQNLRDDGKLAAPRGGRLRRLSAVLGSPQANAGLLSGPAVHPPLGGKPRREAVRLRRGASWASRRGLWLEVPTSRVGLPRRQRAGGAAEETRLSRRSRERGPVQQFASIFGGHFWRVHYVDAKKI